MPPFWLLLAPEAPELLLGLVGIGIVVVGWYLARGIASGIGGGGLVGSVTQWLATNVVTPIYQGISHWVGQAVAGPDKAIGHFLHALAARIRVAGNTFTLLGAFALAVARAIDAVPSLHELHRIEREIAGKLRAAEAATTAELRHLLHRLHGLSHSVAQGVFPRIGALEHDVTKVIPREIHNLRQHIRAQEDSLIKLWKYVRALPGAAEITAAVTAAIAALGLVGLDLLKCPSAKNVYNKRGCGLWNDLDDLLGLALLTVTALDFETMVHAAQGLTEEGVQDFKDVFGL